MRRYLSLSLTLAGALWDASMFLTGNAIDAVRFYHEAVAEILEMIGP